MPWSSNYHDTFTSLWKLLSLIDVTKFYLWHYFLYFHFSGLYKIGGICRIIIIWVLCIYNYIVWILYNLMLYLVNLILQIVLMLWPCIGYLPSGVGLLHYVCCVYVVSTLPQCNILMYDAGWQHLLTTCQWGWLRLIYALGQNIKWPCN